MDARVATDARDAMNAKDATVTTHSPEETIDLAARIASDLDGGDLIALVGNLGTGKTMFVKGLAKGLGVTDYNHVNSPSFVIVKEYSGQKELYHFDVYRLDMDAFCDTLDYEKYFYGDGITVVEWADKVKEVLPEEYLEISIDYGKETERKFTFSPRGKHYEEICAGICGVITNPKSQNPKP